MKKKTLIPMILPLLLLTGCNGNKSNYIEKPVTSFVEKNDIKTYMYMPGFPDSRMDIEEMSEPGQKATTDGLCFFNESVIPYMEVERFVNEYLNLTTALGQPAIFSVKTQNKKVIVSNNFNGKEAIIDFVKGTVTFPCHTAFFTTSQDALCIGDYIVTMSQSHLFDNDVSYVFNKGKEVVIKFGDYNIQGYFHKGKGYLPYSTLSAILSASNPMMLFDMYYNGQDLYMLSTDKENTIFEYFQAIRNDDTTIGPEFMQFNYDTLALIADYRYGMTSRLSRINGNYIKYLDGGAYKALEPYKERLLSSEANVYDEALCEFVGNVLDDGGHTNYSTCSILQSDDSVKMDKAEQRNYTLSINKKILKAREEANMTLNELAGLDLEVEDVKGAYSEVGDTAFVTFDEFDLNVIPQLGYVESQYYLHTDWLVKYANKKIRDDDIKNVVIDLSANGGGIVIAEEFIESWICGSAHSIEKNMVDGSVTEMTFKADVDGNGKYDSNDYIPSDVKVYCMVSPSSFSCGNMLPSRLKEFSNTKFIGDRSGGGCCTLEQYRYLPVGGFLTLSSWHNSMTKDWRTNGGKNIDDGVEADFYKIGLDDASIKDFCDYEKIVSKIHESK